MSIYFGPTAYAETDATSADTSPWPLLKSIPVDFSAMPSTPYGLCLLFTAGEIQFGPTSGFQIMVGGTATGFDGKVLWSSGSISAAPDPWTDVADVFTDDPANTLYDVLNFTNPNPAGTSWIKIFGRKDAGEPDPTGIRNFTLQVQDAAAPVLGPTVFAETDVLVAGTNSNVVLKSIPVDFSTLATSLRLELTACEIEVDGDHDAALRIIVGGGASDLAGTIIWESFNLGTIGWTSFDSLAGFADVPNVADFQNPNPAGTSYIKLTAQRHTGGTDPSGWRNFTVELSTSPSPAEVEHGRPPGGFGEEAFGDPFGVGGPLNVVRARAIESQKVRVTFDEEPVHDSPAGLNDALNPSNYTFEITSGTGTAPQAEGVDKGIITGPALGVSAGDERGVDVHVDKPLIVGLTYLVTVRNVESKVGGELGAPYSADFPGVLRLSQSKPPQRKIDFVDFQNSPFGGALVVDDSGDVAPEGSATGLRKRMLRRAYTPKNAFSWLPGYGTTLRLKKNAGPAELQAMKSDLQAQILQEPEVKDVLVTFSQLLGGVLIITMTAKTKKGAIVTGSLSVDPAGAIVVA